MVIKISFNGATIRQPGSYSKTSVALAGGFPLTDTGIVAILGEATQGEPGDSSGVTEYNCNQLSALISEYVSGPIVDAARLLVSPTKDPRIPNGAQKILVWKTNSSTRATLNVQNVDDAAVDLVTLTSANYGMPENQINVWIENPSTDADTAATLLSSSALSFPFTVANGDTLILSVNGTDFTLTVSTAPGGTVSLTQSQWVTLLNGSAVTVGADTATPVWAAVKPAIFSASSTDKILATLNPAVAPLGKYENMWEYAVLTAKTSNIKTKLNFTGTSTVNTTTLAVTTGGAGPTRGSRGARTVHVNKGSVSEDLGPNDNSVCLSIYYTGAGSAATMSISGTTDANKTLTTTCTGATADNLSLTLANFTTIQDLVTYIDNFNGGTKYICVTSFGQRNTVAPTTLDRYDAIDIKSLPLNVKRAMNEIESEVNDSSELITIALKANVYGQLETIASTAKEFLSGAVKGGSTDTDFSNGLDALLGERANLVVPLISQDASADITAGKTDAASTYTIASVNAAVVTHCNTASNTKNRNERQSYVSILDTFANCEAHAMSLAAHRATVCFQNVDVLNVNGELETMQPWAMACIGAGMQAGAPIGTPTTFKYINAYGISHSDFDPVTDTDDAIDSGLFVVQKISTGGFRIVVQNTSYGADASFVWNRANVIGAADFVAYDMRQQLEAIYVGSGRQRGTATVNSIQTTVVSLMRKYLDSGIIVGDSVNGYLGYRNLVVSMNGSTVNIEVTITPETGVEFILCDITLDSIRDTAA